MPTPGAISPQSPACQPKRIIFTHGLSIRPKRSEYSVALGTWRIQPPSEFVNEIACGGEGRIPGGWPAPNIGKRQEDTGAEGSEPPSHHDRPVGRSFR